MSKDDIRKCRYTNCKHESRDIDISSEEYKLVGTMYYHSDCFAEKELADNNAKSKNNSDKSKQKHSDKQLSDMQLIRSLWETRINSKVSYGQLFGILNVLMNRGYESDYLVFVVDYIINNNMNLKYPPGLYNYVNNWKIKNAYDEKLKAEIKSEKFIVRETEKKDTTPKFAVKNKQNGFDSILGGR